jgi:hypothetical protein
MKDPYSSGGLSDYPDCPPNERCSPESMVGTMSPLGGNPRPSRAGRKSVYVTFLEFVLRIFYFMLRICIFLLRICYSLLRICYFMHRASSIYSQTPIFLTLTQKTCLPALLYVSLSLFYDCLILFNNCLSLFYDSLSHLRLSSLYPLSFIFQTSYQKFLYPIFGLCARPLYPHFSKLLKQNFILNFRALRPPALNSTLLYCFTNSLFCSFSLTAALLILSTSPNYYSFTKQLCCFPTFAGYPFYFLLSSFLYPNFSLF